MIILSWSLVIDRLLRKIVNNIKIVLVGAGRLWYSRPRLIETTSLGRFSAMVHTIRKLISLSWFHVSYNFAPSDKEENVCQQFYNLSVNWHIDRNECQIRLRFLSITLINFLCSIMILSFISKNKMKNKLFRTENKFFIDNWNLGVNTQWLYI